MPLGSTLTSPYKAGGTRPTAPRRTQGSTPIVPHPNDPRGQPQPATPQNPGNLVYSDIPVGTPPPTPGYSQNMPGVPNTNGSVNPNQNQPTYDAGTAAANQLAAQYQSQYDANMAQRTGNWQYDRLLADSMTGANNAALTNATNNSLALNDEARYRNGLDGAGNALDSQFIRDTWGLTNEQKSLDDANYYRMVDQTKLGYDFANSAFDLANRQTAMQEGVNTRSAVSDASGRGAMLSAGYGDNLTDIKTQADISRQGAFDNQRQAHAAVGNQLGDLYHNQASSNIAYRNDTLGFQHQLDKNDLAKAAIDSMAKEYGIRAKDMQQSLAAAIQKNNLNNAQVISQLNQAYQSGNAQEIAQMNQFLATLMGA
jgi:hypothetical protein